jgi:hypothetical protein
MDTVFVTSAVKSLQGNICAQLFVSDRAFVAFYSMKKQQEVHLAVKQFAKEVGAPEVLFVTLIRHRLNKKCASFALRLG